MDYVQEYKRVFYSPGKMQKYSEYYQVKNDLGIAVDLGSPDYQIGFLFLKTLRQAKQKKIVAGYNNADNVDWQSGKTNMKYH